MDGNSGLQLGSERGGSVATGWARSANRGRWAIGDVGLRWLGRWGRSGSVGQWGWCGFVGRWRWCGWFVVASCAGVGDVERVRGWETCWSWESERLRDLSWMRESEWETGGIKERKEKRRSKLYPGNKKLLFIFRCELQYTSIDRCAL